MINKPCSVKVLRFCEELLAASCQLTLQACDSLTFPVHYHLPFRATTVRN